LHGLLCGKLCGGLLPDEATWLEQTWEFLDISASPGMEVTEAMIDLLRITIAQFHSENYDVQLLVPGDDVDLDQRVQALSQWCHGFLSGFGSSGIDADEEFSPSSAESVRDLAAIVQASIDDSYDDEEEAEQDYFNVGEYVRMAVLTLYADFGQREFDRTVIDPLSPADGEDDGPTYH
jgi:uncharacterized protein YgfB (UPF0149 family)